MRAAHAPHGISRNQSSLRSADCNIRSRDVKATMPCVFHPEPNIYMPQHGRESFDRSGDAMCLISWIITTFAAGVISSVRPSRRAGHTGRSPILSAYLQDDDPQAARSPRELRERKASACVALGATRGTATVRARERRRAMNDGGCSDSALRGYILDSSAGVSPPYPGPGAPRDEDAVPFLLGAVRQEAHRHRAGTWSLSEARRVLHGDHLPVVSL